MATENIALATYDGAHGPGRARFLGIGLPTTLVLPSASIPERHSVLKTIAAMLSNDDGQGLVEYALIIALVSIVCLAALNALGNKANNSMSNAANQLS